MIYFREIMLILREKNMKILLSIALSLSLISIVPIDKTYSQTRAKVAAQVRAPARVMDRAVTMIKPADVHRTSELAIVSNDAAQQSPATSIRAVPANPSPRPGGMGTLQQAPKGKLKVTLTPKNPAFPNRAYLGYQYPQSTNLSNSSNFVAFSKGIIPGLLTYSFNLEKDKKYLVEIIADPWGTSGGNVKHTIGQQASTHEFSTFNTKINISRVVQASESGWVSGSLMQGDDPNNQWRVYSVSINEMD